MSILRLWAGILAPAFVLIPIDKGLINGLPILSRIGDIKRLQQPLAISLNQSARYILYSPNNERIMVLSSPSLGTEITKPENQVGFCQSGTRVEVIDVIQDSRFKLFTWYKVKILEGPLAENVGWVSAGVIKELQGDKDEKPATLPKQKSESNSAEVVVAEKPTVLLNAPGFETLTNQGNNIGIVIAGTKYKLISPVKILSKRKWQHVEILSGHLGGKQGWILSDSEPPYPVFHHIEMMSWLNQKSDSLKVRVYFESSTGKIEDISAAKICIKEELVAPVSDIGIQIPIDKNNFEISYYPYIEPSGGGGDSVWSINSDFPCEPQKNSPGDFSWTMGKDGKLGYLRDGHGTLTLQSSFDPALHKAAKPYMLSRQTFYYYYIDEQGHIEYKSIPKHPIILIKRWVAPEDKLLSTCFYDWVTVIVGGKPLHAGKKIRTVSCSSRYF